MADLSLVAIVCRIVLVQVFRGHGRIGFVFVRVRRSDLLLAAIAVAGVLAGLMLTVAAKIGVTGPVLIGVGIVVAVAAAVSGIRAQVAAVVARQHLQSDRLDSILVVPVQALGELTRYGSGYSHPPWPRARSGCLLFSGAERGRSHLMCHAASTQACAGRWRSHHWTPRAGWWCCSGIRSPGSPARCGRPFACCPAGSYWR